MPVYFMYHRTPDQNELDVIVYGVMQGVMQ
jgi:hypothetical protein